MFSKLFGRKKNAEDANENLPVKSQANWAFLGTDMHSHFLPGIDDGAKTIDDSLNMLRAMKDMGYKSIITTPDINASQVPRILSCPLVLSLSIAHNIKIPSPIFRVLNKYSATALKLGLPV